MAVLALVSQIRHSTDIHLKTQNTSQSYVHWRVRICSRRPARAGSDAHGSGSFDANAVLHASLYGTLVTTQQLGNKKNFIGSRHLKDAFEHRKKSAKRRRLATKSPFFERNVSELSVEKTTVNTNGSHKRRKLRPRSGPR